MSKRILSGILLAGVVLLFSIPAPSLADPRDHRRPHVRHEHKHHQRHHWHHRPRHPRVHIGVRIGRPYGYPSYPHGHHLHVHSPYCPVVVEKRIYHHYAYAAPTWHIYYDTHYTPQTILHIEVVPQHGDVYVDGRYLGQAQTFDNGQVRLAVPPGQHAVQLRYNGASYTRHVHVKSGSTAVVQAHLQ